jgi:hypothetical protein
MVSGRLTSQSMRSGPGGPLAQQARRRVGGAEPSLRRGGVRLHSPPCLNSCTSVSILAHGQSFLRAARQPACARAIASGRP